MDAIEIYNTLSGLPDGLTEEEQESYLLDIQINPRYDAQGLITSGLVIGNTDSQRVNLIVRGQKGEFKEYPTLGFGADNYWLSAMQNKQQFVNDLIKELKSEGFNSARVTVGEELLDFEVLV